MHSMNRFKVLLGAAAIALAGCAGMMTTKNVNVSLSGAEQVPPVSTAARAAARSPSRTTAR